MSSIYNKNNLLQFIDSHMRATWASATTSSADWLQARQDAVKISQDALVAAQARQAFYADRTRVEGKLKMEDLVIVWLWFGFPPDS